MLSPVVFAVLLLLGLRAPAHAQEYRIQVQASPARIAFTPDSKVTVNVTVLDAQDTLAPDGTAVYLHTTLGTLPTVAYTQRGRVSVLLENAQGPGLALVTVTVGNSRRTVNVEFLGESGAMTASTEQRLRYRLQARQVYYSVDQRIFDLREDAEFITPQFTVRAQAIQFDVEHEVLTAQMGVVISAGDAVLSGEKLRLSRQNGEVLLIQVEPEVRAVRTTLPALTPLTDAVLAGTELNPLDPQPTKTWIISREATVYPGDQIHFRRPDFFIDSINRRLLRLPYHVLDLQGVSNTFFNSEISLTSDAGLNIDFPVYYAANDGHIGSLHLRNVTKGSSLYRGTDGLQVGLEEEYLVPGYAGDGALYLDDLLRPTRSASWEHNQDFGQTATSLTANYERYDELTPYTTRLGATFSRPLGTTSLHLRTDWSRFNTAETGVGELEAYLPPLPLASTGLSFNITPYLGMNRDVSTDDATGERTVRNEYYEGIRLGLGVPQISLLGGSISTSVNDEISHADGLYANFFDTSIRYRRDLSRNFSTSLGYSLSLSSTSEEGAPIYSYERLSFDLSGGGSGVWNLYSYASYDIDTEAIYATGMATVYLPWDRAKNGAANWWLRYRASYNRDDDTTADHLVTLGRNIGNYSVLLHYSPTGNTGVTGIGTGTGKNLAIELVRQGW